MNEIYLFYKLTKMSGRNLFYLCFFNGLISFKKYWRVAKNLVPVLKGVIQLKFYLYEIFTKIQTKEETLNFLKT